MTSSDHIPAYHEVPDRFRNALSYSEAVTGFSARLIEKDYYCSMILQDLASALEHGLAFKGGTCLSKVHADFYRLSEDLDFAIPSDPTAARSVRRKKVEPLKTHLAGLSARLPCLETAEKLRGHNTNKQYVARCSYRSVVSTQEEFIKLEISIREPALDPLQRRPAHTILIDPYRNLPAVHPISISVLSVREAYAEKLRAALTRRAPAIRDFYDIAHAIRIGKLNPMENHLLDLVRRKLAVPGCESIDVSPEKLSDLKTQLEPQLKPVLRAVDYLRFDLAQAFEVVSRVGGAVRESES